MKRLIYSSFAVAALFVKTHAQTIITQWDFNNITPGEITTATPSTGNGTVSLVGNATTPTSGSAGLGSSDVAVTNLAFQTTSYPAQGNGNLTAGVQFNVSTVGYQNIKLTYDLRLSNTASRWIQIQYTLNGTNWLNFGTPIRVGGMGDDSAGDQWFNQNVLNFSSISGANNNANFAVRVVTSFSTIAFTMANSGASYNANEAYESARNPSSGQNSNYASTGTMRYDMVTFEGDEIILTPTITATPSSLSGFNQLIGSPSAEQSFSTSAINLTENLNINAPSNYEISLTTGSNFQSSLSLTPSNGTVSNTTIYVRLNAAVAAQQNGNITLSSAGANNETVSLAGISSEVPVPFITPNPTSLSGFEQVIGAPSSEQSLTISGGNLTSDISVTAPNGYEVSLISSSGFTNSVILPHVAGTVDPTQVYVRLNHNVAGVLVADLILATVGISNVLVPLSGSVEEPAQPLLAVTPLTLNAFAQNLGFPSSTQIVTVGGENLNSDVTITTNSNFFISTSIAGPFSQSIVLNQNQGYLDPTQIFVHLNATTEGSSNGLMTVSTVGTNNVVINLTGESIQPEGALVYYWHFNNLNTPTDATTIDADFSLIPGVTGKFDYTNPFEGQRDMDAFDTGSLLNSQMGEGAGKACRVRNPSTNRTLDFFVPTNDAYGIQFSYAVHRSGSGMLENIVSYSLNGTDFITTDLENNTITVTESYELHSFDFSDIAGVDNNPNFRIRISFNGNTVAANGNNRYDNITLTANTYLNVQNNALNNVTVYPNPAENIINLSTDLDVISVSLVDLYGRIVATTSEKTFSTQNLNSGMYFMLIETNQGTVQKQVIKK